MMLLITTTISVTGAENIDKNDLETETTKIIKTSSAHGLYSSPMMLQRKLEHQEMLVVSLMEPIFIQPGGPQI